MVFAFYQIMDGKPQKKWAIRSKTKGILSPSPRSRFYNWKSCVPGKPR